MNEYLKHSLKVKHRKVTFNFKAQNEHMLYTMWTYNKVHTHTYTHDNNKNNNKNNNNMSSLALHMYEPIIVSS